MAGMGSPWRTIAVPFSSCLRGSFDHIHSTPCTMTIIYGLLPFTLIALFLASLTPHLHCRSLLRPLVHEFKFSLSNTVVSSFPFSESCKSYVVQILQLHHPHLTNFPALLIPSGSLHRSYSVPRRALSIHFWQNAQGPPLVDLLVIHQDRV